MGALINLTHRADWGQPYLGRENGILNPKTNAMNTKISSISPKVALVGLGLGAFLFLAVSCGDGSTPSGKEPAAVAAQGNMSEGGFPGMVTANDLKLGDIDQAKVEKGKEIYQVKCQACHSLGTNRVVGPGWKGLMDERKPEWVMNMILHTDAMLETDPQAQAMLEECLVRMPNQNLTMDEALDVLEFMRTL